MKYILVIMALILFPLFACCSEDNIKNELQKLKAIEKKEYKIKSNEIDIFESKKKTSISKELNNLSDREPRFDSSLIEREVEEKVKQKNYQAPKEYKEYSFRVSTGFYPKKKENTIQYKNANSLEMAFNYKIEENLSVGISGSFLTTKLADSLQGSNTVKQTINSKILSVQATYFPFYQKDSYNFFIGSKINFFINELELNIPFSDVANKKNLGWEVFGGVLVPLTQNMGLDLTLGYQNRSFYHTYTNSITSTDYKIDFDENIIYMSLGMHI